MSKPPAFQFYAADYLADENVAVMTLEEEGAYIRAMAYCWREGSIPADSDRLSRLLKGASNDCLTVVRGCFIQSPTDPSRLIHPRLEKEREKQVKWREQSAEAGRASGKSRRDKKFDAEPPFNYPSNDGSNLVEPKSNSSSSSSSSINTKTPLIAREGENDSPQNDSQQDDLFPDGLHVNQYASGILERNGVPNGFQMIDATARAITAVATIIKKPLHVAAQGLETRVIVAIQRGETVNRYWMDDSKWRSEGAASGQNHSSPAKQRVGAGVRAFAAAGAAARAARAVGDGSPADGPALPAPGPQRVGGDVSGRLRSAGGDVQPALGHRSTARTAN